MLFIRVFSSKRLVFCFCFVFVFVFYLDALFFVAADGGGLKEVYFTDGEAVIKCSSQTQAYTDADGLTAWGNAVRVGETRRERKGCWRFPSYATQTENLASAPFFHVYMILALDLLWGEGCGDRPA